MADKLEVADRFASQGAPVTSVLRICQLASSTYYACQKRKGEAKVPASPGSPGRPKPGYSWTQGGCKVSDEQIEEWITELLEGEEEAYGYKLLTECLRERHQLVVNPKKVYRLCKEMGVLQKARPARSRHPRRLARNRVVTAPNQLWQLDVKYGYVAGEDRFFFVASILDVFDRAIVGYHRGPSCKAPAICEMLRRAVHERGCASNAGEETLVVRTDNGPQFLSQPFAEACAELQIQHERIPPATPNMNAYIESFHSILEFSLFSRRSFDTQAEAYEAVDAYMDFYNHRRKHGSLKRMAPLRFHEWVMSLPDRSRYERKA